MNILPIPPVVLDPYFESNKNWQIQQQTTRYGKRQTQMTTYYLNNGGKLMTFHYWNNGKKEEFAMRKTMNGVEGGCSCGCECASDK